MDPAENPRDAPSHDGHRFESQRSHGTLPTARESAGETTGKNMQKTNDYYWHC